MSKLFNTDVLFSPAALEEAIRNIELSEEEPYATELDMWLAHVTSPEYAAILSKAADRLSRAGYEGHEAPILEAMQGIDGADNGIILATIEGILIEAHISYLANHGIFIEEYTDWTGADIKTLSAIGFFIRNTGEFYDPNGALEIINELERNVEIIATLSAFVEDVTIEDSLRLLRDVSDDTINAIAEAYNNQVLSLENDVSAIDDIIVAKRNKVRLRLINFTRQYSPTFVKRYLSSDCKLGLSVGEQLTETAPMFFTILEHAGVDDVAMELAAILCLSDIPASSLPSQLNLIIDDLNIELNKITAAKQWIASNEAFLLSLDDSNNESN